eukprot:14979172-Ditylum_brightwellii.AAC.1
MQLWKTQLSMKDDQPPLGLLDLFRGGGESTEVEDHQGNGNVDSQKVGQNNQNSRNGSIPSGSTGFTTQRQNNHVHRPRPLSSVFPLPDARRTNTTSNRNTNNDEYPYSFRLEHREGGALARYAGEERILLFRSDRPGAIAKIIFSSKPAIVRKSVGDSSSASSAGNSKPLPTLFSTESQNAHETQTKSQNENINGRHDNYNYNEEELVQMAQATIH